MKKEEDMDQGTTESASATDGHPAAEDAAPFEWCIVEIFGHRRHAGRGREEEKFGSKMLRMDVPIKGDPAANGWETHCAIFSFTLTDENTALRMNKPYEPPSRYSLPAPEAEDDDLPFEHEDADDDIVGDPADPLNPLPSEDSQRTDDSAS